MKVSPQGLAEIAGHEAIVLSPYLDSQNVWTFGIGHTAAAGPPDPKSFPKGVEQPLQLALDTFARDIRKFEEGVNRLLMVTVSQTEFDALVSFHFNTGGLGRSRILVRLNAGDRAGAAKAFDNWHKPDSIIGRRNAEKRLFATGNYSGQGKATQYPADAAGRVQWSKGRRVDVLPLLTGIRQPAPSSPPLRPSQPIPDDDEMGDAIRGPEAGKPWWRVLVEAFQSLFKGSGR